MVTIFTALRQEATGLIKELGLDKENDDTYTCDGIRLIITGIGKINAAASVGFCLGKYGTSDYYVNYGSAASIGNIGKTFFIGQIIDRNSDDEMFPDIADTDFSHAALITSDKPVTAYEILRDSFKQRSEVPALYDMEASAIFGALKRVTMPNRIIFIKTVTDNGNADFKKSIEMINEATPQVAEYIKALSRNKFYKSEGLPLLDELSGELHCSETMHNQLTQYIKYISASGRLPEFNSDIKSLRKSGLLPAPDRRHGKSILEKMKKGTGPIFIS